jgi:hypothetical protein
MQAGTGSMPLTLRHSSSLASSDQPRRARILRFAVKSLPTTCLPSCRERKKHFLAESQPNLNHFPTLLRRLQTNFPYRECSPHSSLLIRIYSSLAGISWSRGSHNGSDSQEETVCSSSQGTSGNVCCGLFWRRGKVNTKVALRFQPRSARYRLARC